MFCDLAGFTAMSARLDPEDLQAVVGEYQARIAGAVARFGGFIARYVGDGVLVYFGWPEAREGDAERAIRAGLAMSPRLEKVPPAANSCACGSALLPAPLSSVRL